MLTSIAILERELGSIVYARHKLQQRSAAGEEGLALRQEVEALEERRQAILRLLDDLHVERAARKPDAGRSQRARPPRRR